MEQVYLGLEVDKSLDDPTGKLSFILEDSSFPLQDTRAHFENRLSQDQEQQIAEKKIGWGAQREKQSRKLTSACPGVSPKYRGRR